MAERAAPPAHRHRRQRSRRDFHVKVGRRDTLLHPCALFAARAFLSGTIWRSPKAESINGEAGYLST
jgi:hypothetical protein